MQTNNGKKYLYIETFGCQMNKLDSELIAGNIANRGYELTGEKAKADVILFNTCSVREHAEDKAISHAGTVQRLKKKKPDLIVGVVGCMAQNLQDKLFESLPHLDLVVGPRKFGAIPRLIEEVQKSGKHRVAVEDFDDEFCEPTHSDAIRQTRFQAYVKAMEGCDCSCTFCIVPTVRGAEVSRKPEDIVDEIKKLADDGVVEITLLGQTINSYGKGIKPPTDLGGLLRKVHEVEGIKRIRFITSHPAFVRQSLVDAMRDLPKVCKYLHIPAQSGSNRILKLMKRGYTVERYKEIIATLCGEVPGIEIASDFIVGFPTETEDDFAASVRIIEDVRFQNSYIFKYSQRPGTAATEWKDDVSLEVKKERNQRLLDVQEKISLAKNRALIGQTLEVLVEGPSKSNPHKQSGRSDTGAIVVFESSQDLTGRFANILIENATALTLFGKLA